MAKADAKPQPNETSEEKLNKLLKRVERLERAIDILCRDSLSFKTSEDRDLKLMLILDELEKERG